LTSLERGRDLSQTTRVAAVIPAAGAGLRMGGNRPKQFLDLGGKPLLAVTVEAFERCGLIDAIILVVPRETVTWCLEEIVKPFKMSKVVEIIPGGERRQDSVRLGLEASGGGFDLALIHDGARPVVDERLIARVVSAGRTHPAVIAALPSLDTVKEVGVEGLVVRTYERKRVWLVQTPQVFRHELLLAAHQRARREGWAEATDDSLLMERLGIPVRVVEGSATNIKVTTPHDLKLARFFLGLSEP
jgi:2-C-methyl-D-erythritol 4-phosphate cytidylyltransferase